MAVLHFLSPPLGDLGATYDNHLRLVEKRVGDFLLVLQVAQLSQRDRAAGWVRNGEKWKTGTERQYLQTI